MFIIFLTCIIKYMNLQTTFNWDPVQQFHFIVKMLKEWHETNNIGMGKQNYQKLVDVVREIYNFLKKQAKQLEALYKKQHENLQVVTDRLRQFQKENEDLKYMLNQQHQQNKQQLKQMEKSLIQIEQQKNALSQQVKFKQILEEQKQKLQITLQYKETQLSKLELSVSQLQIELSHHHEKQKDLINSVNALQTQRRKYKLSHKLLQCDNEQLKKEIEKLKTLIDKRDQYQKRYLNRNHSQQSYNGSQSFIQSHDGSIYKQNDRQQLKNLQANACYQFSDKDSSKMLQYQHESASNQCSLSKISDCDIQMLQKSKPIKGMKKKIFSSFHQMMPEVQNGQLSIISQTKKLIDDPSFRKCSDPQIIINNERRYPISNIKQIENLTYTLARKQKQINYLKEQLKQTKMKKIEKYHLPRKTDMEIQLLQLQHQIDYMNNSLKTSKKTIFELKLEKEKFQLLYHQIYNEKETDKKKHDLYKKMLMQKLRQLMYEEKLKYARKEEILQKRIEKLQYDLNKNKLGIYKTQKRIPNNMVYQFQGLEIEELDNHRLNTSRHNISDHIDELDEDNIKADDIIRGNLDFSRNFLDLEEQNNQIQQKSKQQQIPQVNTSFESSSSKNSTNAYAQTQQIYIFSDEIEAKKFGFQRIYVKQDEVQTEKYQEHRQNVAIQVLFYQSSQMQTKQTTFIDKSQIMQQTQISVQKQSQTLQKSYIQNTKSKQWHDKIVQTQSALLNSETLDIDNFLIFQASQQSITLRNERKIGSKILSKVLDLDDTFGADDSKDNIIDPIFRIEFSIKTESLDRTSQYSKSTNSSFLKLKGEQDLNYRVKLAKHLLWMDNMGNKKQKQLALTTKIQKHQQLQEAFCQTEQQLKQILDSETQTIFKASIENECQTQFIQAICFSQHCQTSNSHIQFGHFESQTNRIETKLSQTQTHIIQSKINSYSQTDNFEERLISNQYDQTIILQKQYSEYNCQTDSVEMILQQCQTINFGILMIDQSSSIQPAFIDFQCQTQTYQHQQVIDAHYYQKDQFQNNFQSINNQNFKNQELQKQLSPKSAQNPNMTMSTNNSAASLLKYFESRDLSSQENSKDYFKKAKDKFEVTIPVFTDLIQVEQQYRARSKSSIYKEKSQFLIDSQKEQEDEQKQINLHSLDKRSQSLQDYLSSESEKQEEHIYDIPEQLINLPWKQIMKWSIDPTQLYFCENEQNQIWLRNCCYLFQATNDNLEKKQFFACSRGIYCIQDKTFLRLKNNGTIIKQPDGLLLGNSQVVIFKDKMLIRRKQRTGCMIGQIKSGNWQIWLNSRKVYSIKL